MRAVANFSRMAACTAMLAAWKLARLPDAAGNNYESGVPVRWRSQGSQWPIEQIDARLGRAHAVNAAGDAAGSVAGPCGSVADCAHAIIWYAGGGTRELGALDGIRAHVFDIHASGEVVGAITPAGPSVAYIWSDAHGKRVLPAQGRGGAAWALSDLLPDGARLVAGLLFPDDVAAVQPVVWVVRTP